MATNTSITKQTGGLEIAKTYSSQIAYKTVLITGVSVGGIGEATARAFAHGGASLIIATARNKARVEELARQISATYPSTKFRCVALDLSSLQDVRRAAIEIEEDKSIENIDIIVNNAGSQFESAERELTADGVEVHLATNHLGHFLLVKLLLPKLLAAARSNPPGATRLVTLSSVACQFSPFRFSDWNFDCDKDIPASERPNWPVLSNIVGVSETSKFNAFIAYGQSKTANALFAVHFSKLFSEKGIFAFTVNPGGVNSTAAKKTIAEAPEEQKATLREVLWKTTDQGSSTVLVAASDPQLSLANGVYLEDNQLGQPVSWAVDENKAEMLWKLSEDLIAKSSP